VTGWEGEGKGKRGGLALSVWILMSLVKEREKGKKNGGERQNAQWMESVL